MTAQTFYNLLCDEDERGLFTQAGHKTAPSFKQPKLEVTGSQAFMDWIEGKDLKKLPTDLTP